MHQESLQFGFKFGHALTAVQLKMSPTSPLTVESGRRVFKFVNPYIPPNIPWFHDEYEHILSKSCNKKLKKIGFSSFGQET